MSLNTALEVSIVVIRREACGPLVWQAATAMATRLRCWAVERCGLVDLTIVKKTMFAALQWETAVTAQLKGYWKNLWLCNASAPAA